MTTVSHPTGTMSPSVAARAETATFGRVSGPVTDVHEALGHISRAYYIVTTEEGVACVAARDREPLGTAQNGGACHTAIGYLPGTPVEALGDEAFRRDHGVRMAYHTGAMANGIGSVELVEAMARANLLGFFGSAGLTFKQVEAAVHRLTKRLDGLPYGVNFIHSPNEPALEEALVDLYIEQGVSLIEASAFLDLTLPVVRYRVHGIRRDASGRVVSPNRVIAKVSRIEVARKFLSPPPEDMLRELVVSGAITEEQAKLAAQIPVAQDLTAEADSGGHTDNRPAIALLPTMIALRDQLQEKHRFDTPPRVGLAGGISTPASVAAAFAMGAAYVVTGSINQACIEAGTSDAVREMLAAAEQPDVAMAPAADMFEMGVKVQVLKRGTMFSMRAAKLYELYRAYESLDAIPHAERSKLEKMIFRASLDQVWRETMEFFNERDPSEIDRAKSDPKHKMALVFRWYLGQTSNWANQGDGDRKVDYQVWCGPAMGAFNEWVKGSFLKRPENRSVVTIALNLMYGAAVLARGNMLRAQNVAVPPEATRIAPQRVDAIEECMQ